LNLDCGNLVEFSPCAKELNSTLDQSVTTDIIAHTWTAPYDGWVQLRVTDNEGAQGCAYAYVKITHTVDLASFAGNFGRSDCAAGGCQGDFNTDGDVDGHDLNVLQQFFKKLREPTFSRMRRLPPRRPAHAHPRPERREITGKEVEL
jgi:hypothetical protein